MSTKDEAALQNELVNKGLTAARITPADVDRCITAAQYWCPEGTTTTVACLTLRNGFTVIGESACASPENFDADIGQRLAYDNARNKIWALEGYLLRERLHAVLTPTPRQAG
jgi:Phage protein (N4 Gp49/phage Sf6 gene 66) family